MRRTMISDKLLGQLESAAIEASKSAYCPYSGFSVGAAILDENECIYTGCNVENASYGLTICAERNAVFQAVAKGARKVVAAVVYTPTATPAPPCGACRQVLFEFGPDAEVVSICDGKGRLRRRVRDLLPEAFGPSDLD